MNTALRVPGSAYRAGVTPDAPLCLAPLAQVYTKAVDARAMTVTSILTYPVPDLAGDEVKSDGGDWAQHKAFPWVGLEHHRYFANDRNRSGLLGQPGVGREPVVVGWTTPDRTDPDAPYTVELKSFLIDGERHTLPVGTTYFDGRDRLSAQTFAMTERGDLPGTSLEFSPVLKARRQRLPQSPLERRPAYYFDAWHALGFVHCAIPVNPGALVCKGVQAAADGLLKALTDKRVGGEVMHPILFKSLSRYLPPRDNSTVIVRVENKAMPADPIAPDVPATDYDAQPDGAPPLNGVQVLLNHAQAELDSADQLEQDAKTSDSPEIRKLIAKLVGAKRKGAKQVMDSANKHDAKLNGTGVVTDEDSELEDDDEDSDLEDSELDDAPETDADGVLKSVRACYRPQLLAVHKAVSVRRIPLAEVRSAPVPVSAKAPVTKAAPTEPDGDSPEDIARLEAALKERKKLQKNGIL